MRARHRERCDVGIRETGRTYDGSVSNIPSARVSGAHGRAGREPSAAVDAPGAADLAILTRRPIPHPLLPDSREHAWGAVTSRSWVAARAASASVLPDISRRFDTVVAGSMETSEGVGVLPVLPKESSLPRPHERRSSLGLSRGSAGREQGGAGFSCARGCAADARGDGARGLCLGDGEHG